MLSLGIRDINNKSKYIETIAIYSPIYKIDEYDNDDKINKFTTNYTIKKIYTINII